MILHLSTRPRARLTRLRYIVLCAVLSALARLACAVPAPAPAGAAAPRAPAPALVIESFGPVRGYAVGGNALSLVATVRNAGTQASPGSVAFGRMYCLAGLDYHEGDTIPLIPALAPGASVTYRWTVRPNSDDNALVASFSLLMPSGPPVTRVLAIPHFADETPTDPSPPSPIPVARASRSAAVIENSRVRLRIVIASTGMPIALLWARAGAGWRRAGTVSPFAEVLSAEGTQEPWWEFFRVDRMRVSNQPRSAAISLSGAFGLRWRATVTLSLNAGSGAVEARLRLTPARPMRIVAIRLCPLLAGDGGLGPAPSDSELQAPTGPNIVSALRWGTITAGALRPNEPEIPGWRASPLADIAGADYHVVGWEMRTPDRPLEAALGAQYSARVRLLALTPTHSAADARHISFTDPPVRLASLAPPSRAASASHRRPVLTPRQKRKAHAAAQRRARAHHRIRASSKRAGHRTRVRHRVAPRHRRRR